MFIIIIVSLVRKQLKASNSKDKKKSAFVKQQLLIAVTLAFLFGLGWGIGLLSTQGIYNSKTARDVFATIFVLATTFHGFFIFVMHCLRSKEVRNIWRRWFCCGSRKEDITSSTFTRSTVRSVNKADAFSTEDDEVALKKMSKRSETIKYNVEKQQRESYDDDIVVKETVETSFTLLVDENETSNDEKMKSKNDDAVAYKEEEDEINPDETINEDEDEMEIHDV